jgi:hypothetical protein
MAPPAAKLDPAGAWRLVEVDHPQTSATAQCVSAEGPEGTIDPFGVAVIASIPARADAIGPRRFRLEPAGAVDAPATTFEFRDLSDKSLGLFDGGKPVLVYNHGEITDERVPKDDPRRRRACYLHPVYGLNGEVLTGDFPPDHFHHHGIFWTWPHVEIDGKEYDIWAGDNIHDRFVGWIDRRVGPVGAVLAFENGWYVGPKKVMIERVWLRVYRSSDDARAVDVDLTLIPVDRPITLRGAEDKSYGGLAMRFDVPPGGKTTITVPDGVAPEDLPDTRLPWADLSRQFEGVATPSGAAIMISPEHPDFPPTWLTRHYGILCVGYPGVKGKTFEPGKPLRMSYRVWIHKTAADAARLKQAHAAYDAAVKAAWQ